MSTHWAPYWWTCDVCSQDSQPDYVLKTESLEWDLPVVLEALGLDINAKFPDVRVTGNDDDFSEGNRVTEEFVGKYTNIRPVTKCRILPTYLSVCLGLIYLFISR